jgi:hypothetical protein
MENIKRKMVEQENSYTCVLRTIIKQKEEIAVKFKKENDHLKKLLFKQQRLLNKLNEDNMRLNKQYTNSYAADYHTVNFSKVQSKPKRIGHDENSLFDFDNETSIDRYVESHDTEQVECNEEHV